MDKKLKNLEKQYTDVSIPKELDLVVERALKQGRKRKRTVLLNGCLARQRQLCYLLLV